MLGTSGTTAATFFGAFSDGLEFFRLEDAAFGFALLPLLDFFGWGFITGGSG